jgi:hypothetical protein
MGICGGVIAFGPNGLDNPFGLQVKFQSIPADLKPNRSPKTAISFWGCCDRSSVKGLDRRSA